LFPSPDLISPYLPLQFNPVSLSGLIIELTAICKTFSEKMTSRSSMDIAGMAKASVPHMGDCLLFQLTRCFRKRLFKMWEKIIESDRITISFTTLQQGNNESNVASTSLKSEHDMEVDEQAPYMKYIEALAFRVPAPVSSAGQLLPRLVSLLIAALFGRALLWGF
jgi:hypothetical protein